MNEKIPGISKFIFYITPGYLNAVIIQMLNGKVINFKGALLSGFSKFILLLCFLVLGLYMLWMVVSHILSYLSIKEFIKILFTSPFIYIWFILISYGIIKINNPIMEIIWSSFIMLLISQYLILKRFDKIIITRNQKHKASNHDNSFNL